MLLREAREWEYLLAPERIKPDYSKPQQPPFPDFIPIDVEFPQTWGESPISQLALAWAADSRKATAAAGEDLDIYADNYGLKRAAGESDDSLKSRLLTTMARGSGF